MTKKLNMIQQMLPPTHYDERVDKKTGKPIKADMLVLHASTEPVDEMVTTLKNRGLSVHYIVGVDGCVIQCVDEAKRAWHAGAGSWKEIDNINAHSIGIEIENPTYGHTTEYPAEQMQSVQKLCADIIARHGIRPENVLAHSDMAPTRKPDPGRLFPWAELAKSGIGLWPTDEVEIADDKSPKELLEEIGYPTNPTNIQEKDTAEVKVYKTRLAEKAALYAFQRRFMPTSIPDTEDPQMDAKEYLRNLENKLPETLAKYPEPDTTTIQRLKVVASAYRKSRLKNI